MSRLPASGIVDPVFWQVQFAIDEGMSLSGHVGEEDANLTVALQLHLEREMAPVAQCLCGSIC